MFRRLYSTAPSCSSLGVRSVYRWLSGASKNDTVGHESTAPNKRDSYGGLHIDVSSLSLNANIERFVQNHIQNDRDLRTVWIKLTNRHYAWLERLSKFGFKIHHSRDDVLVLFKSLQETSRVPNYAFTNIGVGAVVVNANKQILFVKEKHPFRMQIWKFPGGYAEQGEEIHRVAEREVLEETGIVAKFESILLVRHIHKFAFDCADMYFVCLLNAENTDIEHCNKEIDFCEWHNMDDILPQLSPFNRLCLEQYSKYIDNPTPIVVKQLETPYLPIPKVTIYSLK